jgi:60 kDa SS-A/Ro ribonucleoprotein
MHMLNALATASDIEIMRAAMGQAPSLAYVIKLVHPKSADAARDALYGSLIGGPYDVAALPEIASAFDQSAPVPEVPGKFSA